ncbi:MAG: hypothetical protein QF441_03730 [Bacteriovoracaceae bacterium]|jgi:predicted transcriptional regulator|nr:hypothetical protein [Bacteriovoracaceae bacterium]
MKAQIFVLMAISFFVTTSFAKKTTYLPEKRINQINKLTNSKKIHQELIKLKKQNKKKLKKLEKEKTYLPNKYHYLITLDFLLDQIPARLNQMPTCKTLSLRLKNAYKTDWKDMPSPTHHLWVSFKKICKRN